jgi:hypothetical protein
MNEYRQESDADSTSSEFYFSDETEEHDDGFKNAMKMLTIKRQEEVGVRMCKSLFGSILGTRWNIDNYEAIFVPRGSSMPVGRRR